MVDYLLLDAQYFLTRNFFAVKSGGYLSTGSLLRSFLQTVFKLQREHQAKKIILCWDRAPYFKIANLPDYKGNRIYRSQTDVDSLTEKAKSAGSIAEQAQIEKERDAAADEVAGFKIKTEAKYAIINNGEKFGLCSMAKKGYEADDISYIAALFIHEKRCTGKLIASDGDWMYFVNPSVSFFHTKRSVEYSFLDICKLNPIVGDYEIPLQMYKVLFDMYHGSHNNLNIPNIKIYASFEDLLKNYIEDSESFQEFKQYTKVLDQNNYVDDLRNYCNFTLNDFASSLDMKAANKFSNEFRVGIPDYKFAQFMDSLDKCFHKKTN